MGANLLAHFQPFRYSFISRLWCTKDDESMPANLDAHPSHLWNTWSYHPQSWQTAEEHKTNIGPVTQTSSQTTCSKPALDRWQQHSLPFSTSPSLRISYHQTGAMLLSHLSTDGDHHQTSNNQPVTLTQVAYKVLEHIICMSLLEHYDKHRILPTYQYGICYCPPPPSTKQTEVLHH